MYVRPQEVSERKGVYEGREIECCRGGKEWWGGREGGGDRGKG